MVSIVSHPPVGTQFSASAKVQTQPYTPSSTSRVAAALARFAGTVFLLAAIGIWIVTVPLWDHQMWLMRGAASILFLMIGFYLLHSGTGTARDEIHFYPIARSLHHIQRGPDGIARPCQSLALDEMGEILCSDDTLTIHASDGAIVMVVSGLPRDMLRALEQRLTHI